ncbi:MAG: ABC transporter permease [Rhodocyclaceae bacterium]|nr:ABC transporter permease [Rhodocyclaceae bacterium]
MKRWLVQHADALRDALRRIAASPLSTALSLFVIGIALTLPAAGWLLIDNVRLAARSASGVQQISLFMAADADRKAAAEIESRLQSTAPGAWRFVPREEALKRLQGGEGMAEIVASLPRNPLPDAFVVEPADTSPAAMDALAKTFAGWPRVAHVQLDSAWAHRFDALLRIGRLAVAMLGAVFAAALVAVTFNTIRLQILAQAAEIEVARLIGATDGWIRRPFLYFGALQGAAGGLLAAALAALGTHLLNDPVAALAALYGSGFALRGPTAADAAALAGIGALLGLAGAQISVAIHLRRFG